MSREIEVLAEKEAFNCGSVFSTCPILSFVFLQFFFCLGGCGDIRRDNGSNYFLVYVGTENIGTKNSPET